MNDQDIHLSNDKIIIRFLSHKYTNALLIIIMIFASQKAYIGKGLECCPRLKAKGAMLKDASTHR